jgi:hypothetical protein
MRFKAVTLGFVLAGTALGSAALTLGRARGAAWIGQPLELVVPIQTDPAQADGALCAEAEVFHGDSRQDGSRIQVTVLPTEQADAFNLRINSTALIDEPVVTVYLRAGCSQKSSRKYVLLADFPGDTVAPLSRTVTPVAMQVPLVIPVQAAPVLAAPAQGNGTEAPKEENRTPKSDAPATAGGSKAAAKEPHLKKEGATKAERPLATEPAASSAKPRLRLDPIETLNARVKTLESTTTAAPARVDVGPDVQKMRLLQSDLKTLLDQAVKNEASLLAMRERLEKAESDRVPVALVYGLGGLVVLCLGALVFLWTRRPRQPAWDNSALPGQPVAATRMPAAALRQVPSQQQDMDVNMVDMDDESFDQLMQQSKPEEKS